MSVTRRLGLGALGLGLAAPFAGDPYRRADGRLDVAGVIKAIESGSDHVSARQLAVWIRDRRRDLRIVDVRSADDFANGAIPTAENIPLPMLADAVFRPEAQIVLYSEEGAHGGQAWVLLRALGVSNAVFIPGGLADWEDEVMSPRLAPDLPQDERNEITELSHFFGGSPSVSEDVSEPAVSAAERIQRRRRRGC